MNRFAGLLILMGLCASTGYAQDNDAGWDEFATTIRTGGRYVEGVGVELRFFPERRVVMETGFREGFVLERSTGASDDFVEIARLLPYDDANWDAVMEAALEADDGDTYDLLDLARGKLNIALTPKGGALSLDEGIRALRAQKADEDFEHAVFVLTAARDAAVAQALALSYLDEDVVEGQQYTYRIATAAAPPVYQLVPGLFTIETVADAYEYHNEVWFYEGDTWINFVWEENDRLSLYMVERKDPGADVFVPLNEAPRINLRGNAFDDFRRASFRDENLENYQRYTYRFYGHNVFGEKILFAEVDAMSRDRTPPEQPRVLNAEHHKPDEVLLEWEMNDPPAPDLFGFVVARAHNPEGDYQIIHPQLLPPGIRSFTDTSFVKDRLNYYVIQAVDTAFNVSSSLPVAVTLIDTIPPARPVFLSGSIDTTGVVTLEVQKNTEADLMGYRLFKANDPDHEFSVIFEGFVDNRSLRDEIPAVFTDTVTLNALTPKIYYKVQALDFNFNQSEFSETMVIERPDTIPPTTPVFRNVISSTSNITLYFALSESHDVAGHTLYRSADLSEPWQVHSGLANDDVHYEDTEVEQGITYYYSIRARDHSGLYSNYARPVTAKAYDDGVRPPVQNLALETVNDDTLILTWEYPQLAGEPFFIVYRMDEQGHLGQYRRTTEKQLISRYDPATAVRYAVKAFTADGGESPLSDTIAPVID